MFLRGEKRPLYYGCPALRYYDVYIAKDVGAELTMGHILRPKTHVTHQ